MMLSEMAVSKPWFDGRLRFYRCKSIGWTNQERFTCAIRKRPGRLVVNAGTYCIISNLLGMMIAHSHLFRAGTL